LLVTIEKLLRVSLVGMTAF